MEDRNVSMGEVLLGLVKSRKFVLVFLAVVVAVVFAILGKIDVDDVPTYVALLFGGLAALIGLEDAADKHARGRRAAAVVAAATAPPPVTVNVTEAKK